VGAVMQVQCSADCMQLWQRNDCFSMSCAQQPGCIDASQLLVYDGMYNRFACVAAAGQQYCITGPWHDVTAVVLLPSSIRRARADAISEISVNGLSACPCPVLVLCSLLALLLMLPSSSRYTTVQRTNYVFQQSE
jgi:hypothetical protein